MKLYIRSIYILPTLLPNTINKCLVLDGFKIPYVCQTNDIRNNMLFKQICI